jgi:hypothetical protein
MGAPLASGRGPQTDDCIFQKLDGLGYFPRWATNHNTLSAGRLPSRMDTWIVAARLRFCSSLSGYPRSRASAGSNAQILQRFRVESISASSFIADEQSGQVFGLLWHGHPVRLLDGQ